MYIDSCVRGSSCKVTYEIQISMRIKHKIEKKGSEQKIVIICSGESVECIKNMLNRFFLIYVFK